MRPASQSTEEDLLELINMGEQESLVLEYKASDALGQTDGKKNELCKDISAFANSAGGTIVYGMLENGHAPTALDSGSDKSIISKEWLEQVINSRIHRRIDGLTINQIELTNLAAGRVAYVVSIPQSVRSPHQAFDKRFYKRFNFQSVPMEEYEVRDSSRRSETPDLSLRFSLASTPVPNANLEQIPSACTVLLTPVISNAAPAPANYVVINIFLDSRITTPGGTSGLTVGGETTLSVNEAEYKCRHLHMNHGIPGKLPIFQGTNFRLLDHPLRAEIAEPNKYLVAYELAAPGMFKRLEAVFLVWDGVDTTLVNV